MLDNRRMSADQPTHPLKHVLSTAREYLTHWFTAGVILTLTGFTPDHWVERLFHGLKLDGLRDSLPAVDYRIVSTVAVIFQISRMQKQQLAALVPTAAPAPGTAPVPENLDDIAHKPSIAVLPFVNMSDDKSQDYFADGITEDIITELSRFRDLFVISRSSSFKYKGQPVSVQKFASELGVQYVLEGSVRKAGKHVRITVQLIAARTDRHVWAERYDRDLEDIFAIQDELTSGIVAVLAGRVEAASRDRAARKTTDNMAGYECVLTGKLLHHRGRREDNLQAQRLLDRAIALDPSYANAHAWKACVLGQRMTYGWFENGKVTAQDLVAELETALALDENDSDVHRILAAVNLI
jgi:adenylate cyclase